jgi:hypothetical protein
MRRNNKPIDGRELRQYRRVIRELKQNQNARNREKLKPSERLRRFNYLLQFDYTSAQSLKPLNQYQRNLYDFTSPDLPLLIDRVRNAFQIKDDAFLLLGIPKEIVEKSYKDIGDKNANSV